MKRVVWIILVALAGFATILIARFPATWAAGALPEGVACSQIGGSVWNGSCAGLVAHGVQVGNVSWSLRALPLLLGKAAGHVDVLRGADFLRADVEATRGGAVTARNVQADIALDPSIIPQLPRGLSGRARGNLAMLRVENGIVRSLVGQIEARDLVQRMGSEPVRLGDYRLTFGPVDSGGDPVGQLESLGGPLDVNGTLRLTSEPGFALEGLVAAQPDAAERLKQQLMLLGSPDAQGKRQFSLAASF
jgi:hypothetical protein